MITLLQILIYLTGFACSLWLGRKINIKENLNSDAMLFVVSIASVGSWITLFFFIAYYIFIKLDK